MSEVTSPVLARAIGNNLIASSASLVCGLLFAPIFFRMLGAEEFGVFGVAQVFVGVYALLEFGAGAYVVRELAKALTINDDGRTAQTIICFGSIFSILSSCFAAILLMLTALPILDIWQPNLHHALSSIVLQVALLLFFTLLQAFLGNLLSGCQLQNSATWFSACTWVLRIFLGWGWATWQTPNAAALLKSQILAIVLVVLVQVFFVRNVLKNRLAIPENLTVFSRIGSIWHAYLRFAISYYPANLLGSLIASLDRIVLVRWLGASEFGCFTVAKSLVSGMYALAQSLANYAYPAFASSLRNIDALRKMFLGLQFAMLLLFLPTIISLLTAPDLFMALYSGGRVFGEQIAWYLVFLVSGFFFSMTGTLAHTLMLASGNERSYFLGSCISLFVAILGWSILEITGLVWCFLFITAMSPAAATCVWLYIAEKKAFPQLFIKLVLPGWLAPWALAVIMLLIVNSLLANSWLKIGIMLMGSLICVIAPNYLMYRTNRRQ